MARSAILAVRIIGDSTGATRAMSSASGSASGFAAKFGAISGMVSGAVSSMTSSVIGHVTNLAGEMAETSDSAQSFANTLRFAGVDGSQIQKLTRSTQEYADQTVFSLSDIRNTTAQLASNGVKGYGQLAEAAGNLTAVAGGGADAYKSVAMALTQTAGAGRLTTENWNQLADAIPGASGKLQEAMKANGAYTGDFRDAMAKGQITSDEFNQALLQLGMSEAAKKAANDTSQLGNAAGNADAAIVKFGSKLLDVVKPEVTAFLGKVADTVSGTADKLPGLIEKLGQWASGLQSIVTNLAPVVIGIGGFTAGISLLYAVMNAGGVLRWVTSLSTVTSVTRIWTTTTTMARNAQAAFNLVLEANPIGVVITLIAALVAGLVWFFTQTQTGQQAWSAFASFLGSSIANIRTWFGQAGDWIMAKWQGVQSFFSGIPGAISGFFSGIGGRIGGFFDGAANLARNAWRGAVDFFRGIPGAIAGFFAGIGEKLTAPFRTAVNGIKSLWNSVVGGKGFDVPDWVPGVGGRSFRIPMLADGGTITRGGTALVGEAGPELLSLPMGARVTPLSGTSMARTLFQGRNANGSQSTPIIINLTVNGILDGEDGAKKIRRILADYDSRRR